MKRGGPIQRKTELRRGAPMRRAGLRPATDRPARKTPKDTGPTRAVRAQVWIRDAGTCVACGGVIHDGMWWSLQHRKARGQGGTNDLTNLIVLCGSATSQGCHRRAEDRDRDYRDRGYWVSRDADPSTTPILLVRERGNRLRWVLPTSDGDYIDTTPPKEDAA